MNTYVPRIDKTNKKLVVITVNYNGLDDTKKLIKSIYNSNFNELDIVVVDNGSINNESINIKKEFPETITIRNKSNLGFTGGFNTGLRYALSKGYKFILILNNDTILDKNAITELMEPLKNDRKIAFTSPKLLIWPKKNILDFATSDANFKKSSFRINGHLELDSGKYNKKKEIDVMPGSAIMTRKEIIEEVGLFNEDYFTLHEDFELSYRVKIAGKKILYVPSAKIFHKRGISGDTKNILRNYLCARNRCLFVNKYLGFKDQISYYIYIFKEIYNKNKEKNILKGEIKGYIDGLLNKKGKPKWIKD